MTSVLFEIDKKVRDSRFKHYATQKMTIVRALKDVAQKAREKGEFARECHRRTSQYLSFVTKARVTTPKTLEQQTEARRVLADMHETAIAFDELAGKVLAVAERMEQQLLCVTLVDGRDRRRKKQ